MIRLLGASLLALFCSGAFGQSANPPRKFEVASVHVHEGPLTRPSDFSSSGTRLALAEYTVLGLVREAYDVKNYQVSFASNAHADDVFYDIDARAEGEGTPTRSEFQQMLQALLADRFQLKVHHDMKETPVYALVVGRNGPKFKESASDAEARHDVGVNGRNQFMKGTKVGMQEVVATINNIFFLDRPAVDRTGLTGAYDIRLEATPEYRINNNPGAADISTFSAVQDQLGLKLEPQKAMIDILVVDHIEKPSAN